ncbi:site-specific integrase [Nitratireductor sp. L15S-10]|uniref:site-specific integrase n=1 Tax=Nitratireductor sp. L15S-10 TaxID=3034028 RepID=UPI003857F551
MATVRKRNEKWQVQVRRVGQQAVSKTFQKRSDALQWAREQEVLADKGALSVDTSILRRCTFGDLVDRYLSEITPQKKSAKAETYVLRALRKHKVCRLSLRELDPSHFAKYRDERIKTLSPTGLKREFVVLKHVLSIAQREWGIPLRQNPIANVRLDVADRRRDRRLGAGELDRLLEAFKFTRNRHLLPIALFALETAMRRGEILSMIWSDIDLVRALVTVPVAKNGYSRTIPLTVEALGILKSQKRVGDRVFPTTSNAVRLAWEKLVKRAGIDDLHFHDLRHEAISRFFERGLTVPEVASISGHRDIRMLLRYAHASSDVVQLKLAGDGSNFSQN